MSNPLQPAWTVDSVHIRLASATRLGDLSPDWAFGDSTGTGVRVAVIDSGIDASHPALDDCVDTAGSIAFWVDDTGTVVAVEGPHDDEFGHGTACAGIIHSVAPDASITSVKVLGAGFAAKAAAFHAGLAWAVDHDFDIINLSLGTKKREWALEFHEVCDRAYFSDSFVVTAANNMKQASFPSLYASVASVACNTGQDSLRYHYNPAPPTEFLARGIDVEVPWLNGAMAVVTGNSFAAPHLAGLAAIVKSNHPELRPFQLKTVLWACAANVQEAGTHEIAGRTTRFRMGPSEGT